MNLTLCINEADLSPEIKNMPCETWIVTNADTAAHPVPTSIFNLNSSKNIDYTLKIPVEEKNPDKMYVYFTLCTYGSVRDEIVPIARTKAKLSNLPLDGCSQFKLELFGTNGQVNTMLVLSMIGTFTPKQVSQHFHSTPGTNNYIF